MLRILILVGVYNQVVDTFEAASNCAKFDSSATEIYRKCITELVDDYSYLQVKCQVYALTENQYSILPNSTIGILVGSIFKSTSRVNLTSEENQNVCLKMMNGQVKKINPAKDQSILSSSNRYYIDQVSFIPLMSVTFLDFYVKFDSNSIVGSVTYDPTCIRNLISLEKNRSSDKNVVVTECVHIVRVLKSVAVPGDSFTKNFDVTQLFNKDALSIILTYINDFWLDDFNGTVLSLTLTFQSEFATFPKLAVSMLSHRKVVALHFPNNGFTVIRSDDIPPIPSLKVLDFTGCSLKTIAPSAFSHLPNLLHLNLAENRLSEIPLAVSTLPMLESLNVSSNLPENDSGFDYSPQILRKLSRLKNVDLSRMRLTSTSKVENLTELEHLQVVNLSWSSLDRFPRHLQQLISNVEILDLSNNMLTAEIMNPVFENNWTKLHTLDLSGNRFNQELDYNLAFGNFPKLNKLNLANNRIGEFAALTIPTITNDTVKHLNLSNNNIKTWTVSKLNITAGNSLGIDLTKNNITEVNPTMLSDFSLLDYVYLGGIPLDCHSCFLNNLQTWLAQNETSNDFATAPYKCAYPKEMTGQVVTQVKIDPELCMEKIFNWLVKVVIPMLVLSITATVVGTLVFNYRWHLRYFWHLFQAKIESGRRADVGGPLHRYDAFVSYCSYDQDWVIEQMIPALEQQEPKLHLCIHERDFELGGTIINNVIDCIDSSTKSIFLISKKFIHSQWCQWELQMAQHKLFEDKKDVLVLILLEELGNEDIPIALKRLMSSRTYLIWPDQNNAAGCKLFWSRLRHCVGQCHCLQPQLNI